MIVKIEILILVKVKNSIVTTNVGNSSFGENRINLSKFLNNDCVNIYMWHGTDYITSFFVGRDASIIYLNYKK